jgi:DHA1 family bicyclomycin/chloramphenicol resistance-like MFS transporter
MDNLVLLLVMLFLTFTALGLIIPASVVLAMDDHGPIAGMASALIGTVHMLTGGIVIAIISQFSDGTVLPMVTAIALCATGVFILSRLTLQKPALEAKIA